MYSSPRNKNYEQYNIVDACDSIYRPALAAAARHADSFFSELDRAPVAATADLAELRLRLGRPLAEESVAAERVIDELASDAREGLHASAGGRFFGWVTGGALPAAVAADWLSSVWDQNAASYSSGPAAAVAEEVVGEWLKELLGLPRSASFALVSGCQMAHFTCLAVARHALLARTGWDVEKHGLAGAPRFTVLASEQCHSSIDRALRFLGFGTACLQRLPCATDGRLAPATLAAALAARSAPLAIVCLQAGDLSIGAYDSFAELVPLAREHGAWIHVDGAFGLWAAASPRYAPLLVGAELADSWAADGHKWLNVPYDCGYAFVADGSAHRAAMAARAAYITYAAEARDAADWNPEWSRRARAFPTYAAIRQLGRRGIADLVDRCCEHARAIVQGIGSLPGAQVVWTPQINQGLVAFPDPRPDALPADHDRRTDEVIAQVVASGEAHFSGTTWRGRRAMRVSVCNWRTSAADVARAIAGVEKTLRAFAALPGETNL